LSKISTITKRGSPETVVSKLLDQNVPGAQIISEYESEEQNDGKEFPPLNLKKQKFITKQQKDREELKNELNTRDKKINLLRKKTTVELVKKTSKKKSNNIFSTRNTEKFLKTKQDGSNSVDYSARGVAVCFSSSASIASSICFFCSSSASSACFICNSNESRFIS